MINRGCAIEVETTSSMLRIPETGSVGSTWAILARTAGTSDRKSPPERTNKVIAGQGLWANGKYISSEFVALRVLNLTSATTPTTSR